MSFRSLGFTAQGLGFAFTPHCLPCYTEVEWPRYARFALTKMPTVSILDLKPQGGHAYGSLA